MTKSPVAHTPHPNRQFYTLKFNSSKLRALNYCVNTTFDEAHALGEIVSLGDSQMLRSIRDVRKRTVDKDKVERLYAERKRLRRLLMTPRANKQGEEMSERLRTVEDKIHRTMYIPDYVTVVMEHKKHYEYIFKNGIYINGKKYVRFSCSAGQARVSTVVLCCEEIAGELRRRFNNGRNEKKPIAPSKFNAYFGLNTSATKLVSEPRFCVVPDYHDTIKFLANWDTETDWDRDDDLEVREIEIDMNRADGMGLISPDMAARWAEDLELDYVPGTFVVRQNFLKGLLAVFDIQAFVNEVAIPRGGSYFIETVWKDAEGKPIFADVRNIDVIVTESLFKLWDSFDSQEQYVTNYRANKLYWGVTQYAPSEAGMKDILTLNYQFIQTLSLDEAAVKRLCKTFVDWIEGVSLYDRDYMLLFALGANANEDTFKWLWQSTGGGSAFNDYSAGGNSFGSVTKGDKGENRNWIKAVAVNKECVKDPYIRKKIRDQVIGRIQNGCVGEIFVEGNFQSMVSDPFALMEHVCKVGTGDALEGSKCAERACLGLLAAGEYYSHYWNKKGVTVVNTARSPQNAPCENVVAHLVNTDEMQKWYSHLYNAFIVNWHGHETVNWGGSDWDGDIIASTSNQAVIDGVQQDALTVAYEAPTPLKKVFTEEDLYQADVFTFGSIIGSITNKGTNCYALLPILEKRYGKDSAEYKIVRGRIDQCCVAQSRGIDRAKIGRPVKGIPSVWIRRTKPKNTEAEGGASAEDQAYVELMNRILINRYPYFFKYRYPEAKKQYEQYRKQKEDTCNNFFGISIDELQAKPVETLTDREKAWLEQYAEFSPLVDSNSSMNLVCKYIESVNAKVLTEIKRGSLDSSGDADGFDWHVYMNNSTELEFLDYYTDIVECYERHMREAVGNMVSSKFESNGSQYANTIASLRRKLSYVCPDTRIVVNALVWRLYHENPSSSKEIFWNAYGNELIDNAWHNPGGIKGPNGGVMIPVRDEDGPITYLGKHYSSVEVMV